MFKHFRIFSAVLLPLYPVIGGVAFSWELLLLHFLGQLQANKNIPVLQIQKWQVFGKQHFFIIHPQDATRG